MMSPTMLLGLTVILVTTAPLYRADGAHYKKGDKVELYVNKVGPYFNPHETYHYYTLPICRPPKVQHKSLTLGEIFDGDRMAMSLYDLKFRVDVEKTVLCQGTLSKEDVKVLQSSIEELYYFEFVMDNIPLRGFVGHLEEGGFLPHTHRVYLWNHLSFNIDYNGDRIIYAVVSTKDSVPIDLKTLEEGGPVSFTYSVKWYPSDIKFAERGRLIRDDTFFPRTLEIHWLSIINSLILICLLVVFVVVIIARILRKDFARYNNPDEEESEVDENGWKIIHADVFRPPQQVNLFAAILGVGSQFLAIAAGILMMAFLGLFNVHRHGAINSAAVFLYAITSGIAGYISAVMYKKCGGNAWVSNINLTSCLFSLPFFIIWAVVNSIAWSYGTTQALPWTTVVLLLAIWILLGYPLTVLGGVIGKNSAGPLDAPCRTRNIPREIPPLAWYKSAFIQCVMGGFLPFSAISVELYYIFATVWGRQHYTLYGILFIVGAILIGVTACTSIALTYFQLAAEDYRWWWRSVLSAGSTGFFVFGYALFYYLARSSMSGVMQTIEFFGYTLLTCYVFFLALGTVSFFTSLRFVRYIYVNVKMD